MKKGKLFTKLAVFGTCLCAPLLLAGCTKEAESKVDFRVQDGYIQVTEDGETWKNLVNIDDLKGEPGQPGQNGVGVDGKQVEFNVSDTHIQWRYVGEADWNDLIALEEINGTDGSDGATWYTGTTTPSSQIGKDGDLYLNTTNNVIFKHTNGGWLSIGNLAGDDGEDGNKWTTGTALPNNTMGNYGDLFLNTDTFDVYEKQMQGGWTKICNIKATDGANGNGWHSGEGQPHYLVGEMGDFYLDTTNYDIYEKTLSTTWTKIGNIKGAQGEQGDPGQDGEDFTEAYNITTKVNSFKTGTHTYESGGNISVSSMARTGDLIQVYFTTKPGYQLTSYNIETEGYTPQLTIISSTTLDDGSELMLATFKMIGYDIKINAIFSKIVEIPELDQQYTYSIIGHSPYEETSEYTVTGDINKEDVGNYVSILTLKENHIWADGTVDPKAINWSIIRQEVDFSNLTYFAEYDGSEKTFSPIGNYSVVSGTNKATAVGTYEVVVGLKNTKNYIWKDRTTADKTITWTIAEKVVDYVKSTVGSEYRYYTGEEQETPYRLGYGDSLDSMKYIIESNDMFEVTGDTKATEIGTYSYTFTLKNPNYILSNGKNSVTFSWQIKTRTISFESVTKKYNGKTIIAYEDSTYYTVTGEGSATNIGQYEVTLSLKDKEHTCWKDGTTEDKTISWEIVPGTVNVVRQTSYTQTGKRITAFEDTDYYTVWGDGSAIYVGQYTVVLILKENYCWADGSAGNKIITWEIK